MEMVMMAIVILLSLLVLIVLAMAMFVVVCKLHQATKRRDKKKIEGHECSLLNIESGQNNREFTSKSIDNVTNDQPNYYKSRYMLSIKRIMHALYD